MVLAMDLTEGAGLIPALLVGGVVYVGALFGLRVVNIEELKRLVEA